MSHSKVVASLKPKTTTKSVQISELKSTTMKTTTAKLLKPKALKNNKNVLEVHLPTLISAFTSEGGVQNKLQDQIRSTVKNTKNRQNIDMNSFTDEVKNDMEGNVS